MRRILILEALLALLLIGCTGGSVQRGEPQTTPEQQTAASVQPPEQAEEAAPMSEEEVLLAYDRAVEAGSWFSYRPLPSSGECVQIGDAKYCKVSSPRFETMENLRCHLRHIFSEELMEQLLEQDAPDLLYQELQGALYVREDAGRIRDQSKGSQQIQVEQETDTAYSVNITVDLLGEDHATVVGLEFWSFLYELVEDQWVFTSFQSIE